MPRVSVSRVALSRALTLTGGVNPSTNLPVPARPPGTCQAKRTSNGSQQVYTTLKHCCKALPHSDFRRGRRHEGGDNRPQA